MFDHEVKKLAELFHLYNAVEHKEVTLSSGKKSNFYIDCRKIVLSSECINIISKNLYDLIRLNELAFTGKHSPFRFTCIGAFGVGGIPILGAIMQQAALFGPAGTRGFVIRKEKKEHGLGNVIEGNFSYDSRIFLVDDVLTTGNSIVNAIDTIASHVAGIYVIVDREEGGREYLAKKYPSTEVKSLLKASDLN